jgi:hypothetical protein
MTRRRRPTTRPAAAAAIAAALALGLSSCAPAGEDTSTELHASVVQVAERAASGDYAGALAELALLEADVSDAAASGDLDAERVQEIGDAIGLVRTDLEAAEAAATAPAPEEPGDSGDQDEGPGNSGPNKDKEKGKDKGNGNGKGDGD